MAFVVILFQLSEINQRNKSVGNPFSNNFKIYFLKNTLKKNKKISKKLN
jgi:hypothetical protein